MNEDQFSQQFIKYGTLWRSITAIYEECAKRFSMSYASLQTLYLIYKNPTGCTQKTISQQGFLPKQTVNSIIKEFEKKGFVSFSELKSDKRNKLICLSDSGMVYANQIVPEIMQCELLAMERMTAKQQEMLLETTELFARYFREEIDRTFTKL